MTRERFDVSKPVCVRATRACTELALDSHRSHWTGEKTVIAVLREGGVMPWAGAPGDLLVARDGTLILVTDGVSNHIRLIRTSSHAPNVITVLGSGSLQQTDGSALSASIGAPRRMAFDVSTADPETVVYVTAPNAIRRLTLPSMCISL